METRSVIETFAAQRVIAKKVSVSDVLEELLEQQVSLAESRDVEAFIACDRRFHLRIVEATGNKFLTEMYENLRDRQLRMGITAVLTTPERFDQVLREHREIASGLATSDSRKALRAIKNHLDTTLSVLLAKNNA